MAELEKTVCESAKVTLQNKMFLMTPKLKPAASKGFGKIHAGHNKERLPNGKGSIVSCVGLSIWDYSKGTGDNTVRANYNVSPETVDILLNEVTRIVAEKTAAKRAHEIAKNQQVIVANQIVTNCLLQEMMKYLVTDKSITETKRFQRLTEAKTSEPATFSPYPDDYEFVCDPKIVGSVKDEKGLSPVTKIVIRRAALYNGRESMRPWFISIEEGKGVAEANTQTGGTTLKKGSYEKLSGAFINLTDKELQTALISTSRFVHLWEMAYGIPLVKEGMKAMDAERIANAAQNKE